MNDDNDSNANKGIGLLSKITDRDSALKIVKETSLVFIIVGIYQGVVSYFVGFYVGLIDAGLYIFLGFALREWKSRTVAVMLLILSVIAVATTLSNRFGYMEEGGSSIILVVMVFIIAIRAVEATFKLHGKYVK